MIGTVAAVGLALALVLDASGRGGLVVSMVAAILSLSVIVITGLVGQISLVQLALAGIAGFTVASTTMTTTRRSSTASPLKIDRNT